MNTLQYTLVNALLKPGDLFLESLGNHYDIYRWFVAFLPQRITIIWSKLRAWRAYWHAKNSVPAYWTFLKQQGQHSGGASSFSAIPQTDKDLYIKLFPTAKRCLEGTIPLRDTVVDESSGSSGTPYNWVRSLEERVVSHKLVSLFAHYCFGDHRFMTLNGFSMGSWATGLNMGLALQRNGLVKNIGPDVDKILHTLAFWGPSYTYIICGYPPFLKHLMDIAEDRDFPFEQYTLYGLVGGEGMSEGLRDYLMRRFKKVYSGYGATDLEIGIAGETPFSVAVRQQARKNERFRTSVFGDDSRLPMVFQYNPLMHYVEVTENRELVFTITRLNILSPRIRYNIHDEGGIMQFDEMLALCKAQGVDPEKLLGSEFEYMPRLPFLWIYGRKDSTVSVMGANIYPEDLEQCLYDEPELAHITSAFCIGLHEEENSEVRPAFSFEVAPPITEDLTRQFQEKILARLIALNKDFKEAWHEHPETLVPHIQLFLENEGPFAQNSGRIKQVRITK